MLIADVNVFVGAHRSVMEAHHDYREWLEHHLDGPEAFGASELVLSAFLRLVTNHRVFSTPTPVDAVLEFCDVVRRFAGQCDRASRRAALADFRRTVCANAGSRKSGA